MPRGKSLGRLEQIGVACVLRATVGEVPCGGGVLAIVHMDTRG